MVLQLRLYGCMHVLEVWFRAAFGNKKEELLIRSTRLEFSYLTLIITKCAGKLTPHAKVEVVIRIFFRQRTNTTT